MARRSPETSTKANPSKATPPAENNKAGSDASPVKDTAPVAGANGLGAPTPSDSPPPSSDTPSAEEIIKKAQETANQIIAGAQHEAEAIKAAAAPAVVSSPVAPQAMVSRTVGTQFIANQHTGGITFPVRGKDGISLQPIRLVPGAVTEVDAEIWVELKKIPVVQYYLDKRLIVETDFIEGEIPVKSGTSSELIIPEHLKTASEKATTDGMSASAEVKKEIPGTVTIG